MQSAPSDAFVDFLRARTDIVRLIGEHVTLHADSDGRVYRGICPFHLDHQNSLTVDSNRRSYKCRVCNEGGDCFSFLMRHDNSSLAEALEVLTRRVFSYD